ncbi:MAG TPA: DUF4416 family protein [Terriglobales bacterium]
MAAIQSHRPVLLIMAAFSRYAEALDWARGTAEEAWGEAALVSERFAHRETNYYEATMGPDLLKTFLAFESLIDPAELTLCKETSNQWEVDYQRLGRHPEPRPLNLDPGYLTEAKLVLATTKDRDHRLYLDRGIYAENTLFFHQGKWQPRPWTYPDYLRADYHQFFVRCREFLRRRYST